MVIGWRRCAACAIEKKKKNKLWLVAMKPQFGFDVEQIVRYPVNKFLLFLTFGPEPSQLESYSSPGSWRIQPEKPEEVIK